MRKMSTETKEQLKATSKQYEKALEDDLDSLLERAKTIALGTVAVGAGFWIAYRIFKSINSSDSEETEAHQERAHTDDEPSFGTILKQAIVKELAIFLLGILKDKITEYLQRELTDEKDPEQTT